MKVVLDTNLFVASYWNEKSSPRKIIQLAQFGELKVIWSKDLLEEVEFILKRINVSGEYFKSILSIYTLENQVFPKNQINIVSDYSDNRLLEASEEGNADFLITSDRELLKVGRFGETKIIKPSDFLSVII